MSDLKDKVASYLSSFLELEEWKATRDDPYGSGLVAATHDPNKKAASAAKAELKAKAAAPVTGALAPDQPLAVERPKAVTPTLSRGAHATPPDVKSVEPQGKADPKVDIPAVKHSAIDVEPSYKPREVQHSGGLANPHPYPSPSPEMKKSLSVAAGTHVRAQVDKMFAGKAAIAANKASLETGRAKDAALIDKSAAQSNITKPEGGRTHAQRHSEKRLAWKRARATATGPLPAPPTPPQGPQGAHSGRVGTAVTNALIAATNDPHKKHLLRQQTRSPNNTPIESK